MNKTQVMRSLYALLSVVGALAPLSQFVPWLLHHGLAMTLLLQQIVDSPISAFAWLDVLISAVVLLIFIVVEGRRLGIRHLWLPIAGLCLVGVSLALPLFLLMRENRLARASHP